MNKGISLVIKKNIKIIICFLAGFTSALSILSNAALFWNTGRTGRMVLLAAGSMVLMVVFIFYHSKIIKIKIPSSTRLIILIILSLCISFYIWTVYPLKNFSTDIQQQWLGGLGFFLIELSDFIFAYLTIPFLIFSVLVIIHSLFSRFWDQSKNNLIQFIGPVFSILFLLMCLCAALVSPDIRNIEDNYWGRSELVRSFLSLRMAIGDKIFNNNYLADGHWITQINQFSRKDYQNSNPFSDEELNQIYLKLNGMKAYLDERGIAFMVVIVPHKNTVYPEYVPEEIPVLRDESQLDQVLKYQRENGGIEILDLRPVLLEARSHQQTYQATDTHWNAYGAFSAYEVIMRELAQDFPALEQYSLDDFDYIAQGLKEGDLSTNSNLGLKEENFTYQLKHHDALNLIGHSYSYQRAGQNHEINTYTAPGSDLPDLLMYHDSFGYKLMEFLKLNFHKSTFVWANNDLPLDVSFIDSEQPDIVIIEFTEGYLKYLLNIPDLQEKNSPAIGSY
jgi:hypothetical protein